MKIKPVQNEIFENKIIFFSTSPYYTSNVLVIHIVTHKI